MIKKLKPIPQNQEQDKDALSSLLSNIVLEVLARTIRQRKRHKRHPNCKKKAKLQRLHKKLLEIINNYGKRCITKYLHKHLLHFLYDNELARRDIKKSIPFITVI